MSDDLPTVVNRHWYRGKKLPAEFRYIGRGTPLGNPYTVGEHGMDALALYRRWLWVQIRSRHPDVLAEMRQITPQTLLGCSCKPRPCHGDVVVRAWQWMRDESLLS